MAKIVEFSKLNPVPLLPRNTQAEQAVLGAILLDKDAWLIAASKLSPRDFFEPEHREIFSCMLALSRQGSVIDLVTVNDKLERTAKLDKAGGSAYVASLLDGVPFVSHVEHYAAIVNEKALRRRILSMACDIERAVEGEKVLEVILGLFETGAKFLSAHCTVDVSAEGKTLFCTAAQLASEVSNDAKWIARPWVVVGAVTELAGKVKAAGKTTFTTHLVAAVLEGRPFLGEPTIKTPVVYLTEQPGTSFRVAIERAGLLDRDDLFVLPWHLTMGFSWERVAKMAVEECQRRDAKLLVVDTLAQFAGLIGDSENNAGDALLATQPLQKAAAEGLAVLVVRHERKSGGSVGDSGRGSSAYGGAADIVLSLRRAEGNSRPTVRVIHGISRFDETPDELVIELVSGNYVSLGRAADMAAREAEELILATAPESEEEAASFDQLIEGTSTKRTTAQRTVKALLLDGRLARTGRGRKRSPFKYFLPQIRSAQTSDLNGQEESGQPTESRGGVGSLDARSE